MIKIDRDNKPVTYQWNQVIHWIENEDDRIKDM